MFIAKKPKVELSENSNSVNEFISELTEHSTLAEGSDYEIKIEFRTMGRGGESMLNPFPGDILTTLFPVTGCVTPVYFL